VTGNPRPRVQIPPPPPSFCQYSRSSETLSGDFPERSDPSWTPFGHTGIEDRDADIWEALLAVAELAGGHCPTTARASAVALVAESKASKPTVGVMLLGDVRAVFDEAGLTRLPTSDLLAALNARDDSPWAVIRRGQPLNARGLSERLRKYGIEPNIVRDGANVFRGYIRAEFEDAWSRYCPRSHSLETVTSVTSDTARTDVTDVTALCEADPEGNREELF
jgi:Protein of unknown function (DUF3631)